MSEIHGLGAAGAGQSSYLTGQDAGDTADPPNEAIRHTSCEKCYLLLDERRTLLTNDPFILCASIEGSVLRFSFRTSSKVTAIDKWRVGPIVLKHKVTDNDIHAAKRAHTTMNST